MKRIFIILLLFASLTAGATKWYCAPSTASPAGNDANAGAIATPMLTLNHAWTHVAAGDTVYMRGGTYNYTAEQYLNYKSGTAGNYINIWNYPGEIPVLDYSTGTFAIETKGIYIRESDYVKVRGLRITGIAQEVGGAPHIGFLVQHLCNNIIVENIVTDHIGGWGFQVGESCNYIYVNNCDSYSNYDPYSVDSYGGGDGFQCGETTTDNVFFTGCRAWWNGDDGWDLRTSNGHFIFQNCWSFWNGYREDHVTAGGNGEGFKVGGKTTPATTDTLRFLYNCISFQNRLTGFTSEPDAIDLFFSTLYYNCVAYDNGYYGFVSNYYTEADVLANCIGYSNPDNVLINANTVEITNSWNGFTVTDADFVSVDSLGADGARQADGSLPLLTFLHLVAGSDLKDAGTSVGLTRDGDGFVVPFGAAPDIGAFEYGSSLPGTKYLLIDGKLQINNNGELVTIIQ